MPQIFHRRSNTIARAGLLAVVLFICLNVWGLHKIFWSPYTTLVNVPIPQPVPFSHQHHVGDLGIDCRYCHSSVEKSSSAGLPPTETCMTCHSQLYTTAPMLAPVRQSLATGEPIHWNRANYVPDFVYFNHGIHINKGIGCSTCHGEMDRMPLTWKSRTLYMKWCLECHENPEKFVRPHSEIFNSGWHPSAAQPQFGHKLAADYHLDSTQLTDCSMCHR